MKRTCVDSLGDRATASSGHVELQAVSGPLTGERFVFHQYDTFLFGRSPDCHAFLKDDSFVSRHHFILEVCPPSACVRDLGSLNGTHVNGKKYGGRGKEETPQQASKRRYPQVSLQDGDRIQVGETAFAVSIRGHAAPGCPPSGREAPPRVGQEPSRETPEDYAAAIPGYEVDRKLGEGGCGTVFLAHRRQQQEPVALKLMLPRVSVDDVSRERFLRETTILRKLRHANIVACHACGTVDDAFWFEMDYCDGGSVADLVRDGGGRLPTQVALPVALQALEGLRYAHERQLVHRDVKPENILLKKTKAGSVALIGDFGLAKSFQGAGFSGLTATGTYLGTYPFMPREQLTDFKYVNPASDVWSFGATLYFMLTGRPPREAKSNQDPLQAILENRLVPARSRLPELEPSLTRVIDRALASRPDERYPTAAEFLTELSAAYT